jgi:hypothetical protein
MRWARGEVKLESKKRKNYSMLMCGIDGDRILDIRINIG